MNSTPDRIGDLVCTYLSEQCTVIIDSEADLRAGENVVHKTRVAVRRLRSTIRCSPTCSTRRRPSNWTSAGLVGGMLGPYATGHPGGPAGRSAGPLPPDNVLGPVRRPSGRAGSTAQEAADAMVDSLTERYRKLVALVRRWRRIRH
jgi:hypothetical protein